MAVQLSDEEWKKKLTPEQFDVLRGKGTEAPFTGQFLHNEEKGAYTCAACGNVLFRSDEKFDSGSGWPSFYDVASKGSVVLTPDNSHGMERTEVTCANCGSHLGHLFHDALGQPTGDRYCINGVSLDFKQDEAATTPKDS